MLLLKKTSLAKNVCLIVMLTERTANSTQHIIGHLKPIPKSEYIFQRAALL